MRLFSGPGSDTDQYLTVAKVRKILAVNKQAAQKSDVKTFNLRKLSELEIRKQYQIKISNRFTVLDNLNDSEDINSAWETIQERVDLFKDYNSIFFVGGGEFSHLLNLRGVNHFKEREIQTAGPLVPEPSAFEVEREIEKLKRHKSPHIDRIPAECNNM